VSDYPRDMIGYGGHPPHAEWPGDARIALQFVLNYEEGGENNVLHGDAGSEQFLSEIIGAQSYPARHMSMESIYEYGSRAGVWRLLREFEDRGLPLTVFAVAMALQRNPRLATELVRLDHEIACHGLRWIHYQNIDEAVEREHMQQALDIIAQLTGKHCEGWYTGRDSPNTRRLGSSRAACYTTPITTATTCRYGNGSKPPPVSAVRTWSYPIRSTPTTCASPVRRGSIAANNFTSTCATASTSSMPRVRRRRR